MEAYAEDERSVAALLTNMNNWIIRPIHPPEPQPGQGRGMGMRGFGRGGAPRHAKTLFDNLRGISKPEIRRLARRGGVKRISGLIYEDIRGCLKLFLEDAIRDAYTYTQHANRNTVTAMDVVYALKKKDELSTVSVDRRCFGVSLLTFHPSPIHSIVPECVFECLMFFLQMFKQENEIRLQRTCLFEQRKKKVFELMNSLF